MDAQPIIILGDSLPTIPYKKVISEYKDIICVIGEGEEAIVKIVEQSLIYHPAGLDFIKQRFIEDDIPNLAFEFKGNVVTTTRSVIDCENYHVTPYRPYLQDILCKNGMIRIEASRGCPWSQCSFCIIPWKYGQTSWRPFPIKKILSEIIEVSQAGTGIIYFTDEEFIGHNRERVIHLCNEILELKKSKTINQNLKLYASTSTRSINGTYNEEQNIALLTMMKDAGFLGFFLGIESGSNRQLIRYNKGVTVDDNILAINLLRQIGLDIDVGFIMFDTEMNLNDLRENLDFLERSGLSTHYSRFGKRLRTIPNTPLFSYYWSKDWTNIEMNMDNVEVEINFQSEEIAVIYNVYKQWEERSTSKAYELQSII